MRTKLKQFRVGQHLKQSEMAEKIGVSRATYAFVENGKRDGSNKFWSNFKFAFDVPDSDMWQYQELDKARSDNERTTQKNHSTFDRARTSL